MKEVEEVEAVEVEVVAGLLAEVAWTVWASPSVRGEVAGQDEVLYCQKALLVQSP